MGTGWGSVILSPAASKDLSWLNPVPLSRTASLLPRQCHLCPSPDPPPARAGLPPAPSMPQQGDCQLLWAAKGHQGQSHSKAVITKNIDMISDSTVTFEKLPLSHSSLYRRKIAIVIWKRFENTPPFFPPSYLLKLNFLHIFNPNTTSQQTECRRRHGNPAIILWSQT